MINIKEMIWQEKYRPVHVKDVICDFNDQILKAITNPLSMQNYILYSRTGGTGKTSMSKAIINDLQCDYLNLNASDERSIDTIRTKVKDFMRTTSTNPNVKKCIIMDEGEKLTKDAADALKNMMEEYSSNSFIILTTNNLDKIPEPLQTRFNILHFIQPNKEKIKDYLINICTNENVQYTDIGINKLIDIHYPSIRKMVNHLQDIHNKSNVVDETTIQKNNEVYENIWSLIELGQYNKIKTIIIENGIDCTELNKHFFNIVISGKVEIAKELKLIQVLARNEKDMNIGADKIIIMISSLPEIIKILRG